MKNKLSFLFTFLIILSSIRSAAQSSETKTLIKEIKQTIQQKSIVKDKIDWALLSRNVKLIDYSKSHDIDKYKIYDVFLKALRAAGDPHSLFLTEEVLTSINDNKHEVSIPSSKYLGNHIGYLKIPKCTSFDYKKDVEYADTLVKQIQSLDQYAIDKWVIDLRDNRGGNVWPMLTGLTPIIGDGLMNYSIKLKTAQPNYVKKGTIHHVVAKVAIYQTKQTPKKIAILINNNTASSGEMLAITLLGFENTQAFGTASRGLTTVNSTYTFKDGSMFFLATGYMADRQKKTYKDGITPIIIFDSQTTEEELQLKVKEWLEN